VMERPLRFGGRARVESWLVFAAGGSAVRGPGYSPMPASCRPGAGGKAKNRKWAFTTCRGPVALAGASRAGPPESPRASPTFKLPARVWLEVAASYCSRQRAPLSQKDSASPVHWPGPSHRQWQGPIPTQTRLPIKCGCSARAYNCQWGPSPSPSPICPGTGSQARPRFAEIGDACPSPSPICRGRGCPESPVHTRFPSEILRPQAAGMYSGRRRIIIQ
jgi:hypothetical protein